MENKKRILRKTVGKKKIMVVEKGKGNNASEIKTGFSTNEVVYQRIGIKSNSV